jgi:signal transduction histidine kinase
VLGERARLARELHDILAHTLSGLTLQLSGATLLAEQTGADPRLTAQLLAAHRLAKDGTANARRAVSALRGDALPGPDALPGLVEETRRATGLPVTLTVSGEPRRLTPEAGLAVYRTVQEALTNTARYAGPSATVAVELDYRPDDVRLTVTDEGGKESGSAVRRPASGPADGAGNGGLGLTGLGLTGLGLSGLGLTGLGLTGLGERAALHGGRLEHGPTARGWRVALTLPAAATPGSAAAGGPAPASASAAGGAAA